MSKTRVEHGVGRHALRTIQSADDDTMYVTVTATAMYMATAGFLEEANSLLGRLWSYNWPHGDRCVLADQGLAVLWHAAGSRPSDAPFVPQPIDHIELAHRLSTATAAWATPLPTRPWHELDGIDLLRRSLALAHPPTNGGPMPSPEHELEALMGLHKYVAAFNEPNGWTYGVATCLAAELAARNGLTEQATHFAVRWAEEYPRFWLNYIFEWMACNRHVAPLLLRRILAKPLGLTEESCRRYLEALLAAVDVRMQGGRTLVYGSWSWARLLAAISKRSLTMEPDLYTEEERHSRWIGRAGATEEVIVAAQARLGVQLPADYLAFVRASNGLSPSPALPGLLPIEEIDYLRHVADPELLDIWKGYAGDDMPAAIESCILVSDREAEEMVLLIPPLTAGGQWQTWYFAHWIPGEVRYPSFRYYMEEQLQDLSARS